MEPTNTQRAPERDSDEYIIYRPLLQLSTVLGHYGIHTNYYRRGSLQVQTVALHNLVDAQNVTMAWTHMVLNRLRVAMRTVENLRDSHLWELTNASTAEVCPDLHHGNHVLHRMGRLIHGTLWTNHYAPAATSHSTSAAGSAPSR